MIDCTHEDNPVLYDRAKGEWTKAGLVYIDTLDRLTGPRKDRLRFGKWVQAEGIVYEGFERSKHLVDRFEIPKEWPRYWVIDFGYTNPFCLPVLGRRPGRAALPLPGSLLYPAPGPGPCQNYGTG
jgi:hypothetical protein